MSISEIEMKCFEDGFAFSTQGLELAYQQGILQERERNKKIIEDDLIKLSQYILNIPEGNHNFSRNSLSGMVYNTFLIIEKEITSPQSPQTKRLDSTADVPFKNVEGDKPADTHISKQEVARVIDSILPKCSCKEHKLDPKCLNELMDGAWSGSLNKEIKEELGISEGEA